MKLSSLKDESCVCAWKGVRRNVVKGTVIDGQSEMAVLQHKARFRFAFEFVVEPIKLGNNI